MLRWFLTGQGVVKHWDNGVCTYNQDSRRVRCDRERERKRGGGKGKRGVNLVCVNADLFLQHFGAGRSIHIATGWWEFVGVGREVTARRGYKSAWILQLFVVLWFPSSPFTSFSCSSSYHTCTHINLRLFFELVPSLIIVSLRMAELGTQTRWLGHTATRMSLFFDGIRQLV